MNKGNEGNKLELELVYFTFEQGRKVTVTVRVLSFSHNVSTNRIFTKKKKSLHSALTTR